jgi:hypothetical protein
VGAVEELTGFEDHLHDVFVAVKARRFRRVEGEKKMFMVNSPQPCDCETRF